VRTLVRVDTDNHCHLLRVVGMEGPWKTCLISDRWCLRLFRATRRRDPDELARHELARPRPADGSRTSPAGSLDATSRPQRLGGFSIRRQRARWSISAERRFGARYLFAQRAARSSFSCDVDPSSWGIANTRVFWAAD
jgi:hypothetical protein